jgi:ketosteroid isomerase-like protein
MGAENLAIVQRGYAYFGERGDFDPELFTDDFVWDMSHFRGWPEDVQYAGVEGARRLLATWVEAWDDWEFDVDELIEAGEKVVALCVQRARSKVSGVPVEMHLAQVWSVRDGRQSRMDMYNDQNEGLAAAGVAGSA